MPKVARIGDTWTGICKCHPTPIPMTGIIISGSPDTFSEGKAIARVGDITIGTCGHTGVIITGSTINKSNGKFKAIVGSQVTGCNIGIVITGATSHYTL